MTKRRSWFGEATTSRSRGRRSSTPSARRRDCSARRSRSACWWRTGWQASNDVAHRATPRLLSRRRIATSATAIWPGLRLAASSGGTPCDARQTWSDTDCGSAEASHSRNDSSHCCYTLTSRPPRFRGAVRVERAAMKRRCPLTATSPALASLDCEVSWRLRGKESLRIAPRRFGSAAAAVGPGVGTSNAVVGTTTACAKNARSNLLRPAAAARWRRLRQTRCAFVSIPLLESAFSFGRSADSGFSHPASNGKGVWMYGRLDVLDVHGDE